MLNLAGIPKSASETGRLPAHGRAWSPRRRPEQGWILPKDRAVSRPDLDSSTPAELVAITGRLNNALRRLGSGWAIFIEAQRQPASTYPAADFPDRASALVDVERRAQFEEEARISRARYFLTLLWLAAGGRCRPRRRPGSTRIGHRAIPTGACAGQLRRPDGRVLALVEGFMPEAHWLE